MNPQQPIWILRNQKINGPHPLSKVVGAKKNGKILPTDQLGTSPSGPWHEWSGFVAEIKASRPPSYQPKDDQPAPHQSQGVYRVNPSIIIINRKAAEFPYRCILSGKTAGLIKQTIHIQAPDSVALLTEGEKKMTPWKWIKRATGFAIDLIPGLSNVKDVVGKGGEFWNYFGLGKTVPVEVFVDKEAFTKWTKRNRRASRWLLYSVGITVCTAGLAVPLVLVCIALRIVMGNRRLLEMNCFNDDWLWLHCREKAFVESLEPSPLPAPVHNWFFGKSELPSVDSTTPSNTDGQSASTREIAAPSVLSLKPDDTASKQPGTRLISKGTVKWEWWEGRRLNTDAPPAWYPKQSGSVRVFNDRLEVRMPLVSFVKRKTIPYDDVLRVMLFKTQWLRMPLGYCCIETRSGLICCQYSLVRWVHRFGFWNGTHHLKTEEKTVSFNYMETGKEAIKKLVGEVLD